MTSRTHVAIQDLHVKYTFYIHITPAGHTALRQRRSNGTSVSQKGSNLVFRALTFAGEMLKTEAESRGFNSSRGTWQTLMYWKTMLDRCNCINETKSSLKFAEMWHYIFTI